MGTRFDYEVPGPCRALVPTGGSQGMAADYYKHPIVIGCVPVKERRAGVCQPVAPWFEATRHESRSLEAGRTARKPSGALRPLGPQANPLACGLNGR